MRRVIWKLSVLLAPCLAGVPLVAQNASGSSGGGMLLSSRVEMDYSHKYVDSAGHSSNWMSFVVIWRGQDGWRVQANRDAVAAAEAERRYRAARIAAEVADRGFFGGGGPVPYWAEMDRRGTRLYLLGNEYAIPGRDSALVVLVDRIDGVGGPPAVVAAAVVDGRLPADVRTKSWMSGDTTFSVRPTRSAQEVFIAMLKEDPIIAAFIGETTGLRGPPR